MKYWLGILVSTLFHIAIFCIPFSASMQGEVPCQRLNLIIEQGGGAPTTQAASLPGTSEGPVERPDADRVRKPEDTSEAVVPDTQALVREPEKTGEGSPSKAEPSPHRATLISPPLPSKPAKRAEPKKTAPKVSAHTPAQATAPSLEPVEPSPGSKEGPGENDRASATPGASASLTGSGTSTGNGPAVAPFGSRDGPRIATRVLPKYPRLARDLGKEGTVLLRLTIDERGRLVHAELLRRAGSGFDEEALRAVRECSFTPARRNGKPVACRADLPIQFVLKDARP